MLVLHVVVFYFPGLLLQLRRREAIALKAIDDRGQLACEKRNFSVSCKIFPEIIPVSLFVISPGYQAYIWVASSQASDNGNQ